MMNHELVQALNAQVNAEFYSAHLYLAMSTYAEQKGLKGASKWLFAQFHEEMAHAIHMYNYILDRGESVIISEVAAPVVEYASIQEVFAKVLEHEQKVTAMINDIATLAMNHQDHACYQFIMWYVNEQVEEESHVGDIISKLDLIGDNTGLMLALDAELGARVFVNPFPTDAKTI